MIDDPNYFAGYPNLGGDYEVTSPLDPSYNCVAHAAADTSRWWWPVEQGAAYWPPGAPVAETVAAFRIAFETLGYEVCESPDLESTFEKVAIYVKDGEPKHVSRQLESGRWTSKMGPAIDIEHRLGGLEGEVFGSVALILRRQRAGPKKLFTE